MVRGDGAYRNAKRYYALLEAINSVSPLLRKLWNGKDHETSNGPRVGEQYTLIRYDGQGRAWFV